MQQWQSFCTFAHGIMLRSKARHIIILILVLAGISGSASAQLNTDRITAIGRNALYFEDYVLSIQYFNQVIKLKPYLAEPYLLRAIAKIQLQDYTGALKDCDSSIELNPFQPGAFYTRGYVRRQLNMYGEAENDFTEALIFAPENKTYLMLRADVRAAQEHFDDAMADMEHLLAKEPQNPTLLFEKGVICLNNKDTACAVEALTATTKYDSQNAGSWSALGVVKLQQGDEDEALEALNKAIDLGSKWAGDYINRGVLNYRRHNYRGAIADYDQAVALAPEDAQCRYNRGMMRAELWDWNRALDDLDKAIELAPEETEMRYQRGMTLMQLGQWKRAAADFDTLRAAYPYFLPAYYLAAQAKTALGDKKAAYSLRKAAYELEQHKDSLQQTASMQRDSMPDTSMQTAKAQPRKKDRRKEFSALTAQNGTEAPEEDADYNSQTRGSIQKRYADVVNEPNIIVSYYAQKQELRRTNYQPLLTEAYNKERHLPSPVKLTPSETSLTADMVSTHFENISKLSQRLDVRQDADLYFARAMEFALVQDYVSAIDDCTKALTWLQKQGGSKGLNESVLYTFCRANWRYKQIEYQRASGEFQSEYQGKTAAKQAEMDFEIMLRDYDYVIQREPDFAFAYYNKANMLCAQKNFAAAIAHYDRAIERDQDFAEAYFNRGLTYIYTDETEKGIADLSKAGELGIYQAYNLITRLR